MLLTEADTSPQLERLVELSAELSSILKDLAGFPNGTEAGQTPLERQQEPLPLPGASRSEVQLIRGTRPPLPDPRLIRRIIRQRQLRARYFDGEMFGDPAWDMLLDLTAARVEHTRVSVTSLCIASGVPPTTALRWIGQMIDDGLLIRTEDEADRRRAFISLTDRAANAMARYFAELGSRAVSLV